MPPTGSSKQPLGGSTAIWVIASFASICRSPLGTALVFVAFMTLPGFDPQTYPQVDMEGGVIPQPVGERGHRGNPGQGSQDNAGESQEEQHGGEGDQEGQHGGSERQDGEHGESRARPSEDQPSSTTHDDDRILTGTFIRRSTTDTGYVATGLLGITLLIGPANLLPRKRNPVSSYLGRDIGAWTAIFSIIHVIFGLQAHGRLSDLLNNFVASDGDPLTNTFGLGNWTGLAATAIVMGLLALSSDFALRKLKAKRWKGSSDSTTPCSPSSSCMQSSTEPCSG